MRLDLSYFAYLEKHEVRLLTAVELGMRNHEWVPAIVIQQIAGLPGHSFKSIRNLLKMKLLSHTGRKYDGYRLSSLGYDYLAIKTFFNKGLIEAIHGKVGVGKESDIYKCTGPEGQPLALKVTRLGRTSFRSVKNNRDYLKNRTQYNWLYLSRLSAAKEFEMMKVLHGAGFPTPEPIEQNRHAILMSFIEGTPLYHVRNLEDPERVFRDCLRLVGRFAEHGLIHGDYNEFNLMLEPENTIRVIDFPQAISRDHPDADFYYDRDVQCIYDFFDKLIVKNQLQDSFRTSASTMPALHEVTLARRLDLEVRASGRYAKQFTEVDEAIMHSISQGTYQLQHPTSLDSPSEEECSSEGD
jgi:RIO kinase 2